MPAFEAEVGMPYWMDLNTSNVRAATNFYEKVLGWEISPVTQTDGEADGEDTESYRMARIKGLPVAGLIPNDGSQPDTWVTYFLSRSISEDLYHLENLGGRVLVEPQKVELGWMALAVDTAGGMFGLIEPTGPDQFISGGEPGTPVWHELSATVKFSEALDFYAELFNWDTRVDGDYALAEDDGAAFAGFWDAAGKFPPHVPSFWQSFLGVKDLDAAAATVTELGGEIIQPPHDSPFGRMTLIADPTGATVTLVEVEEAPEVEPTEGDDLFDLQF